MLGLGVVSLIAGLIAWAIPIICVVRTKRKKHAIFSLYSIASFAFCGIAIVVQMIELRQLINLELWSTLRDITGAVAGLSAFLLLTTILINFFAMCETIAEKTSD